MIHVYETFMIHVCDRLDMDDTSHLYDPLRMHHASHRVHMSHTHPSSMSHTHPSSMSHTLCLRTCRENENVENVLHVCVCWPTSCTSCSRGYVSVYA